MNTCSPEMADRIVKLLLNDPGVGSSFHMKRSEPEEITEQTCRGCEIRFMPKAFGRVFCSKACYNAHLERGRAGKKPRAKQSERKRHKDGLGPGRSFDGLPAAYAKSRQGKADPWMVQAEVSSLFGVRVGITTIYRCWRRPAPQVSEPLPQPPEEAPVAHREEYYVEARAQLQEIADAGPKGLKRWLCTRFGLHASSLCGWLKNGTGISESRLGPLLEWIGKVQRGEAEVPDLEAQAVEAKKEPPVLSPPPPRSESLFDRVSLGSGGTAVLSGQMVNLNLLSSGAPPTPGDAIILEQLQQVAKERLALLSPTMADRVEIVMSLAWKGSE